MKEKTYKTRDEIVQLLKNKGFKETEKSNKLLAQFEYDRGRVTVTVTPGAVVEIRDRGESLIHFRQPMFDIGISKDRVCVMTGSHGNDDWANFYFRRKK